MVRHRGHAADEALPYLFGAFALGHTPAEAYIANQSQVYLFSPGELARPTASPIDQLRDAIAAVESSGSSRTSRRRSHRRRSASVYP